MCKLALDVIQLEEKWNKSKISPVFFAIFIREGAADYSPLFGVKLSSRGTRLGMETTFPLRLCPRQKRTKARQRLRRGAHERRRARAYADEMS